MKKIITLLSLLFLFATSPAQTLLPSIGIGSLPADTTSICTIPWYTGSFSASGLQPGDTAADFTLYDVNGNSFNLAAALALGKPVLLVSASYTCPVFRSKVPSINNVVSTYGSQVTTAIIYCVEAHPTDTSPYFGYVNTTNANQQAGILFAQPTTYGGRKNMVDTLLANMSVSAPVYLDGPCNNWWQYYGPAPNNAYLIGTDGIVFAKHPWYDSYPDNIECDIDSLLGLSGNCTSSTNNGSFILQMLSADSVYGSPGSTLSVDANLINTSADNVLIKLGRLQNNMAPGWASSMCATVCFSQFTDTVTIQVAAGDTQLFHFYFYTDTVPSMSSAQAGFRNQVNTNNTFMKWFYGFTTPSGMDELVYSPASVRIYPVPAGDRLFITTDFGATGIEVLDLSGKSVLKSNSLTPDISGLEEGCYLLRVFDGTGRFGTGKFIKVR
jgi:hypothetical protein